MSLDFLDRRQGALHVCDTHCRRRRKYSVDIDGLLCGDCESCFLSRESSLRTIRQGGRGGGESGHPWWWCWYPFSTLEGRTQTTINEFFKIRLCMDRLYCVLVFSQILHYMRSWCYSYEPFALQSCVYECSSTKKYADGACPWLIWLHKFQVRDMVKETHAVRWYSLLLLHAWFLTKT